jgi:hypothetical protein
MNETKLIYQNCGTNWYIGIHCENEELLEQTYNSFWNHGATNMEPKKLTDTLWYFVTQPARLLKAMTNAALFKMLNVADELQKHDPEAWAHCCKGLKDGFMPQARINAQERFDAMESQANMFSVRCPWLRPISGHYSLGVIRAEKPDSYSNCKD